MHTNVILTNSLCRLEHPTSRNEVGPHLAGLLEDPTHLVLIEKHAIMGQLAPFLFNFNYFISVLIVSFIQYCLHFNYTLPRVTLGMRGAVSK